MACCISTGRALGKLCTDFPHPNVASVPKILQILLLRGEQCLKSLAHNAIHRPARPPAEFRYRGGLRGMIDDVFAQLHGTVRLRLDRERNLTKVIGMGKLGGRFRTRSVAYDR